jgi:hypothetical protein
LKPAAWDLFALFQPERWQAEALANLDASAELFSRMSDLEFPADWPRAKAGAFLFSHGVELFLKAAIAQTNEKFLWGHDLERLHATYRKRLPDDEFMFRSNLGGFVKENAPIPFYDFLKYPERISEVETNWPVSISIDVTHWRNMVLMTAEEARRIWPLIMARYPRDPSRWQNNVDGQFEKRKKS